MARHDATPRRAAALRWVVRGAGLAPRAPWSLQVVGIVVLALLAWLLLGSALSVARAVIALAGYVIVAFVAYHGRQVGRATRRAPDPTVTPERAGPQQMQSGPSRIRSSAKSPFVASTQ